RHRSQRGAQQLSLLIHRARHRDERAVPDAPIADRDAWAHSSQHRRRTMIVTKMALPRRTFLRGAGATLSLPLLDAMVPALTAAPRTAANPAPRLAFWQTANGLYGPDFKPKGEGMSLTSLQISPILSPFTSMLDKIVVATGLSNLAAESKQVGS